VLLIETGTYENLYAHQQELSIFILSSDVYNNIVYFRYLGSIKRLAFQDLSQVKLSRNSDLMQLFIQLGNSGEG
jgi:hypothetical protein